MEKEHQNTLAVIPALKGGSNPEEMDLPSTSEMTSHMETPLGQVARGELFEMLK